MKNNEKKIISYLQEISPISSNPLRIHHSYLSTQLLRSGWARSEVPAVAE